MKKKFAKIILWTLSIAILTTIIVATIIPKIVKKKLQDWAATRGMNAENESVSLNFGNIILHNVHIHNDHTDAQLDSVRVNLNLAFKPSSIYILGGKIATDGESENKTSDTNREIHEMQIDADHLEIRWENKENYALMKEASFHKNTLMETAQIGSIEFQYNGIKSTAEEIKLERSDHGQKNKIKCKILETTLEQKEESEVGIPSSKSNSPVQITLEADLLLLNMGSHKVVTRESHLDLKKEGEFIHFEGKTESIQIGFTTASDLTINGDASLMKSISMNGTASKLTVYDEKISEEPASFQELAFKINGIKEGKKLSLDGKITAGKTTAEFIFDKDDESYEIKGILPTTECQDGIDTVRDLTKNIGEIGIKGDISAAFRLKRSKDGIPEVEFHLNNQCKITKVSSSISEKISKKQFKRFVWDADGNLIPLLSGPNTDGWTRIGDMSPYVSLAAMTTEDPSFRGHRGFDIGAINNAIRDDIETGKFLRGASTITMQLAKNLWLDRQKTASRKISEAILTNYLEQELGKDEIMELYLNIVEFAPGIYGIGRAARYYFKTVPKELSLSQSLFLTLMLPKPKGKYFDPNGKLSISRMKLIYALMKSMNTRKLISDQEYTDGLGEWVINGESRPERVIPGTIKPDGEPDASEWK